MQENKSEREDKHQILSSISLETATNHRNESANDVHPVSLTEHNPIVEDAKHIEEDNNTRTSTSNERFPQELIAQQHAIEQQSTTANVIETNATKPIALVPIPSCARDRIVQASFENTKLAIAILPDKSEYKGQIDDDGKPNGVGVCRYRAAVYYGEFLHGKRHGYGVHNYDHGERYEGEFCQDEQHGFGVYFTAYAHEYCGQWQEGCRHGNGYATNGDGQATVGLFVDDIFQTKLTDVDEVQESIKQAIAAQYVAQQKRIIACDAAMAAVRYDLEMTAEIGILSENLEEQLTKRRQCDRDERNQYEEKKWNDIKSNMHVAGYNGAAILIEEKRLSKLIVKAEVELAEVRHWHESYQLKQKELQHATERLTALQEEIAVKERLLVKLQRRSAFNKA